MNNFFMNVVMKFLGLFLIVIAIASTKILYDYNENVEILNLFALRLDMLADKIYYNSYRATLTIFYSSLFIIGALMFLNRIPSKKIKSHIFIFGLFLISSLFVFVECVFNNCIDTNLINKEVAYIVMFFELIVILDWARLKPDEREQE